MRLFGKLDGVIDRKDRAGWLTPVFDSAFNMARDPLTGPFCAHDTTLLTGTDFTRLLHGDDVTELLSGSDTTRLLCDC